MFAQIISFSSKHVSVTLANGAFIKGGFYTVETRGTVRLWLLYQYKAHKLEDQKKNCNICAYMAIYEARKIEAMLVGVPASDS